MLLRVRSNRHVSVQCGCQLVYLAIVDTFPSELLRAAFDAELRDCSEWAITLANADSLKQQSGDPTSQILQLLLTELSGIFNPSPDVYGEEISPALKWL